MDSPERIRRMKGGQRRAMPPSMRDWLLRQIERREWNRSDLARALELQPGTVNRWMSGKQMPSTFMVRKMADVLGADPDYLLILAGHRDPEPGSEIDPVRADLLGMLERVELDAVFADTLRDMLQGRLDRTRKARRRAGQVAEEGGAAAVNVAKDEG